MASESEKRETLDDIVAEIRDEWATHYFAEDSMRSDGAFPEGHECIDTRDLANRIEAAWKRERDRLMSEPRSWEECVERARKAKENSDDLY